MRCRHCGYDNEPNSKVCSYCGSVLREEEQPKDSFNKPVEKEFRTPYKASVKNNTLKEKEWKDERELPKDNVKPEQQIKKSNNSNALYYVCAALIFCFVVFIIAIVFTVNNKNKKQIYFHNERNEEEIGTNQVVLASDVTSISMNNKYYNQTITDEESALDLIRQDSISEKKKCQNKEITKIEEQIESYGITAVNLCELDISVAEELRDAIQYIYTTYPIARNYLTNFTLYNSNEMNLGNSTIAFFIFHLDFAYSASTYPYAAKTAVAINSSYFLNIDKLNRTLEYSSSTGHFPKNASRSSVVIHELGHYLSYLVSVNSYKPDGFLVTDQITVPTLQQYTLNENTNRETSRSIIREAYQNYKMKYNDLKTEDDFRASISKYAMSKNARGEYLYDETIAEAFHDYYLNKEKAAPASIEIYKVLDKRLKELN